MNETESRQSTFNNDWSITILLIVIALSIVTGRIAVVSSKEGDTAFLSANDRSRWCTIASLVEHGTYEIDQQIAITNDAKRHPWDTIDKVRHQGADGKQHYYSSKPPLLPTMIAGVYWLMSQVTPMTLTEQPIYVARMLLFWSTFRFLRCSTFVRSPRFVASRPTVGHGISLPERLVLAR